MKKEETTSCFSEMTQINSCVLRFGGAHNGVTASLRELHYLSQPFSSILVFSCVRHPTKWLASRFGMLSTTRCPPPHKAPISITTRYKDPVRRLPTENSTESFKDMHITDARIWDGSMVTPLLWGRRKRKSELNSFTFI